MKVAYLLYPRFTALDVVGAFQVFAAPPGTNDAGDLGAPLLASGE
ncbi:hypothetical protein [Georgenia sp. SYP-B2076]|nr:hypothetical protein [Georgenia sp. SYP-B2076]